MTLVEANESWLGKVPADWKRSRIRNEALLSPGFSSDPLMPTETCAVVPMELLSADGAIDFSNQLPFEEIPPGLTLFEPGDAIRENHALHGKRQRHIRSGIADALRIRKHGVSRLAPMPWA